MTKEEAEAGNGTADLRGLGEAKEMPMAPEKTYARYARIDNSKRHNSGQHYRIASVEFRNIGGLGRPLVRADVGAVVHFENLCVESGTSIYAVDEAELEGLRKQVTEVDALRAKVVLWQRIALVLITAIMGAPWLFLR